MAARDGCSPYFDMMFYEELEKDRRQGGSRCNGDPIDNAPGVNLLIFVATYPW